MSNRKLPEPKKGKHGYWIRVRVQRGQQKRFLVPVSTKRDALAADKELRSLARAGASAEQLQQAALSFSRRPLGAQIAKVAVPSSPFAAPAATFADVGEKWTSGELAAQYPDAVKPKRSAEQDASRLRRLAPSIGDVPVTEFTFEHAELAMASLPDDLSDASRKQYKQLIRSVLALAEYPLKLRGPMYYPSKWFTSNGKTKAKSYLYPNEEQQLLACREIPVERRLFYGVLAREGLRCSEAQGLQWQDIDLERGVLKLDNNKTDDPRAWALAPSTLEALRVWHSQKNPPPGAKVWGLRCSQLCARFRKDLEVAGISRAELFERSPTRIPIRLHDLRGSFVTIALANGRSETWVTDRTGHKSSTMIYRYKSAARMASELELGDWGSMKEILQ